MAGSYKWLLDQGIPPGHVVLIGDSAGGALAVTTILRAREQSLPLPAATMPLSPWLDMEATGETFETNAERDLLATRDVIQVIELLQELTQILAVSGAHIMAPRNHSAIAEVIAEAHSAGISSVRTRPSGGAEACA